MDQRNHVRMKHSKNCCSHCGDWFTDEGELEHHIRYAHADKRYQEVKFKFNFQQSNYYF